MTTRIKIGFLAVPIFLALSACSGGGGGRALFTVEDGPIEIGGGEDFTPVGSDNTPITPGEENCEAVVGVNPSSINFGVNETVQRACQTITVSGCSTVFSAEIANMGDASQFTVSDNGSDSPTRLTGLQESVDVCYKRLSAGTHNSRLQILVGSGAPSSVYAIPLTGRTTAQLFTINRPVENQLVWEHDGVSTATSSTITFPVSGRLNSELVPIFSLNEITISSGGSTHTASLDGTLNFSSTASIPSTPPAVHPVVFSMNTSGGTLTKTVNVVRYYRPEVALSVRDQGGNEVNTTSDGTTETDSRRLTAGVRISNLAFSGPNASHPVEISLRLSKPNGSVLVYVDGEWEGPPEEADIINFYSGFTATGGGAGESGQCGSGFEDSTYCVPLPPTPELGRGANTITTTVCNEFTDYETCVTATTTVIVDNNLPRIVIESPRDNEILSPDDPVVLRGYVENYAPPTRNADGTLDCSVKLWVNTSIATAPLANFCPVTTEAANDPASTGNRGNIKRGRFNVTLSASQLNLFTNVVHMRAENDNDHSAIKVISFQRGRFNPSTRSRRQNTSSPSGSTVTFRDLLSGQLGNISPADGFTERSPVMLNVSEGTLTNAELTAVIEKQLNDKFKLKDLIQGYVSEDGEIPANATPNSHASGVRKVMAWLAGNRLNMNPNDTNNACNFNTMGTCAAILFMKNLDDPRLFGVNLKNEPFWSPVAFGMRNVSGALLDINGNVIPTKANGWPQNEADIARIAPNYNFDDVWQGKISIDQLELGNGEISAHLTIHGFKGHAVAFAVCEYGSVSFPPYMPIIFNISELKLRLDHVQIKKIQLAPDGSEYLSATRDVHGNPIPENRSCRNNNCTNKLIINPDNIHLEGDINQQGIVMTASENCADTNVGAVYTENRFFEPFGCNLDSSFRAEGHPQYYWILLETRNELDYLTIAPGPSLNSQLQNVLRATFKDTLWCDVPKTIVNPILDPTAFPYPDWVPEDDRITDLTMAVDNTNNKISIKQLEDAQNPVFTLKPNIKDADILVENDKLKAKLPLQIGAMNLSSPPSQPSTKPFAVKPSSSSSTPATPPAQIRRWGHMYRNTAQPNFEDAYPLSTTGVTPFLGISLSAEEFLHAVTHILFKKGPAVVLDLLNHETYSDLDPENDWTVGIDQIIFGRLGICDSLAGNLLSTDLPAGIIFPDIRDQFSTAGYMHWDVQLDPNHPPTLALTSFDPPDGYSGAAVIQLGLSNIQIAVKDLLQSATQENRFINPQNQPAIIRLRLDGILKILALYNNFSRKLDLYVYPYNQMPLYVSVVSRGQNYNDEDIVSDIYPLLNNAVNIFDQTFTGTASDVPTASITLPGGVTEFPNIDPQVVDIPDNGSCEGVTLPRYAVSKLENIKQTTPRNPPAPGERQYFVYYEPLRVLADTACSFPSDPDNDLRKTLCEDFGISEISFGNGSPNILFDNQNGYLHLSAEFVVRVFDWLREEVDTE